MQLTIVTTVEWTGTLSIGALQDTVNFVYKYFIYSMTKFKISR